MSKARIALIAALLLLAGFLLWLLLYPVEPAPDTVVVISPPAVPTATNLPAVEIVAAAPEPTATPQSTAASTATPEPTPGETPVPKEEPAAPSGALGKLYIGKKSVSILTGIDEKTLKKAPGWSTDTSLPGEPGMCLILGHRNRGHLKLLEDVELGDELRFFYPDGREARYVVTDVEIFERTADWRLPVSSGDTLVLVTCYPFRYTGNAPGKFQVTAELTP